jgi:hypothetical protein
MPGPLKPAEIVKSLLQGIAPPRPLFLPIVFAHAARLEDLPLADFRKSPTKIVNALRQIRGHLRADGVTCYYDPFLEVEALGGIVEWNTQGNIPAVRWPENIAKGELPEATALGSLPKNNPSGMPSTNPPNNPVAVAVEVIRRLKTILREDCLLMTVVSGPLTLAALLSQIAPGDGIRYEDLPASSITLASSVIFGIAKAFVDAGSNVVFIREDFLPPLSDDNASGWLSHLEATVNIVKFYQALPVLLLTDERSVAGNAAVIAAQPWECVVCPAIYDFSHPIDPEALKLPNPATIGLAMSQKCALIDKFDDTELDGFTRLVSALRPVLVTTGGDVSASANMDRLRKIGENIAR